jgi:hypothetical protein
MTPTRITFSIPPQWCGNEYSSMSPFSPDNSKLLVVAVDHFRLLDGATGAFIRDLPISASQEPRWTANDVIAFLDGNALKLYFILTGSVLYQHIFPEYTAISGKGESDISLDTDHLVLCGTRPDTIQEVFVYQISSATKGPLSVQTELFDGLKIDSRNRAILSRADGIYVLEQAPRKVAAADGHAAPGLYNGKPVLLWCSSNDPVLNKNAVVMIDLDSGTETVLTTFDWRYAFHVSCCDQPWAVVSLDCPTKDLPSQCWKVYFDLALPPELICDTGSIYAGYNSQVKAALSRDGSKLAGCSNFGDVTDLNACDAWMIDLSATVPVPTPPAPLPSTDTRIDYSSYVGKSIFVMVPRPDGAVDILERKL